MNLKKLNEYLLRCEQIIEIEKDDIEYTFEPADLGTDITTVSAYVLVDMLKFHGVVWDMEADVPYSWIEGVFGESSCSRKDQLPAIQISTTDEYKQLANKFTKLLDTLKAVVISGNIEAAMAYEEPRVSFVATYRDELS